MQNEEDIVTLDENIPELIGNVVREEIENSGMFSFINEINENLEMVSRCMAPGDCKRCFDLF